MIFTVEMVVKMIGMGVWGDWRVMGELESDGSNGGIAMARWRRERGSHELAKPPVEESFVEREGRERVDTGGAETGLGIRGSGYGRG